MINVIVAIAKSGKSENGLLFNPFHIRNSLEQESKTRKLDDRKTEMGMIEAVVWLLPSLATIAVPWMVGYCTNLCSLGASQSLFFVLIPRLYKEAFTWPIRELELVKYHPLVISCLLN